MYVFNDITPGTYTLNHTFGVGIWGPQVLTADQLIGTGTQPTVEALNLTQFGIGSTQWGTVEVRVYPGETSGRIEVTFKYDTPLTSLGIVAIVPNKAANSATVDLNVPLPDGCSLIVASYDNAGKLIGSSSEIVASSAFSKYTNKYTVNLPLTNASEVKAFIWDSLMVPQCPAKAVDITR
ncbi:hypothetical protein FACS1894127_7440 [Clostridia bacterium]|nr:hypothetical protein FACS1894127_7440 [Clostridia bacterium]